MDKRLETIASCIAEGTGFADVGTDHGYIPIAMVQKGYSGNIFASDIKEKPLLSAVKNAEDAGVRDKISFILCDGLEKCPPEKIDTIVIAGMGGDMICKILDYAEWCMDERYRLILQPMTKQEVVRYWLSNNGFETEKELVVKDGAFFYQIISAHYGGETEYNDAELFAGKYDLTESKETYVLQLQNAIKCFEKICADLADGKHLDTSKLRFYESILHELKEMGNLYGTD